MRVACELAVAETGLFSAKVRHARGAFVNIVREGRRRDGELKDVVEMIGAQRGLVQAFRAEGTLEAESRAENSQEFLGVAAAFEETHEDIEGTLESLEELRAAGVADVPEVAPMSAGTAMPMGTAMTAEDVVEMIVDKSGLVQAFRAEGTMEAESRAENIQEFLGVAADFEETHEDIEGTLESLEELRAAGVADVPEVAPMPAGIAMSATTSALSDALANPSMTPAPTANAAALAAVEVERMYGPLACKALPALLELQGPAGPARVAGPAQRPGRPGGGEPRHHHDDGPLRQGPGVPRGVRGRYGGGHLPARCRLVRRRSGKEAGGGAPPGLRRHHART